MRVYHYRTQIKFKLKPNQKKKNNIWIQHYSASYNQNFKDISKKTLFLLTEIQILGTVEGAPVIRSRISSAVPPVIPARIFPGILQGYFYKDLFSDFAKSFFRTASKESSIHSWDSLLGFLQKFLQRFLREHFQELL